MAMTVHGVKYTDTRQITERIIEINKANTALGESDGRVTEVNELYAARKAMQPAPPNPKPYYVYFRTAAQGKGYREFKTRKGQMNFMANTPHAVTFYN